MKSKIFLGTLKTDGRASTRDRIYLEKHSFDCGWYWGFGYVGNRGMHTHFDSMFLKSETSVDKIFAKPRFTQNQWWVLRDLFVQAYALKKAAEVYRYGGHQTSDAFRVVDAEMAARINADLEKVLNEIWRICLEVAGFDITADYAGTENLIAENNLYVWSAMMRAIAKSKGIDLSWSELDAEKWRRLRLIHGEDYGRSK